MHKGGVSAVGVSLKESQRCRRIKQGALQRQREACAHCCCSRAASLSWRRLSFFSRSPLVRSAFMDLISISRCTRTRPSSPSKGNDKALGQLLSRRKSRSHGFYFRQLMRPCLNARC